MYFMLVMLCNLCILILYCSNDIRLFYKMINVRLVVYIFFEFIVFSDKY